MAEIFLTEDFIERLREQGPLLLDVRSETEFSRGHIPHAFNLPLLNDEHRAIVGTMYKKEGREAAVLSGFDLAGKKFGDFVRTAHEHSRNKEVMIYCWRGGMRSNIMAWVLGLAGFRTTLLKGGYKTFRNWALHQLTIPKKIIVVGGRTGSGKTEALRALKEKNEQVIDLEALAHHKGSAFGALGEKPQPRTEHFENLLAWEWSKMKDSKTVWLENESITIGSVKIPDPVFEMMRNAPVIELKAGVHYRIKRILDVYGDFPAELLEESTWKLKKRLGEPRTRQAVEFLRSGDKEKWIEEILYYYDKTYDYGMEQRIPGKAFFVECPGDHNYSVIADLMIDRSNKINESQPA